MNPLLILVLFLLNAVVLVARVPYDAVKTRMRSHKPTALEMSAGSGKIILTTPMQGRSRFMSLRGGSSTGFNLTDILKKSRSPVNSSGTTEVVVATSIGSVFLDKKKKIIMGRNETISDLKEQISRKFPGSPPVLLQNLYFASRLLDDREFIGNISRMSPVPIVLDMASGTSVYNKTMTVSQALEAYVASVVQQTYLGAKLQQLYRPDTELNESLAEPMDSPQLRELFHSINASVYERYKDEIAAARSQETEPETSTADTAAWRGASSDVGNAGNAVTPLAAAIAKEFDLNWRGVRQYGFYSVVLVIFAYFGTATNEAAQLLLCMIPVLWISKLRQLRLLFKIALNLALPVMYEWDFLMPLLPVPLQVIAEHSAKQAEEENQRFEEGDEDADVDIKEEDNVGRPIVVKGVLPTLSGMKNLFRSARKMWGVAMIKLVDFNTSGSAMSPSDTADELEEGEESNQNYDDVDSTGENDDEGGDGEEEEKDGGEEEEEEEEEAQTERQREEADGDAEDEIDLDDE